MAPGAERPLWTLVGLRCSGKTSVGRELARLRGCAWLDLDAELARAHGAADAGELLRAHGLARFRALEARELARVLAAPGQLVLSTGGGIVEDPANRELLGARTWCVWLQEELPELQRRIRLEPGARPALEGSDAAAELPGVAARRAPWYAQTAHWVLRAEGRTVAQIAQELLEAASGKAERG